MTYAFWFAPAVMAISTLAVCVLYTGYAAWVFSVWNEAFAGQRLNRGAEACPSNRELPDVKR